MMRRFLAIVVSIVCVLALSLTGCAPGSLGIGGGSAEKPYRVTGDGNYEILWIDHRCGPTLQVGNLYDHSMQLEIPPSYRLKGNKLYGPLKHGKRAVVARKGDAIWVKGTSEAADGDTACGGDTLVKARVIKLYTGKYKPSETYWSHRR